MSKVLVVGDIMVDVVVAMATEINRGSDTAAEISQSVGGTAINVATWIKANQAEPMIIGGVGTDLAAEYIRTHLEAWKIQHELLAHSDAGTGMVVALAHPDDERSMFPDSRANAKLSYEQFKDLDWTEISILYISGYTLFNLATRELAVELMKLARKNQTKVFLDPASAYPLSKLPPAELRNWLQLTDYLVPNELEYETIKQVLDCDADSLSDFCEIIIRKTGAEGADLITKSSQIHFSAPTTQVIDSVGAGDAFAGGLISGLSQSLSIEDAIASAISSGAKSVGIRGAQPFLK